MQASLGQHPQKLSLCALINGFGYKLAIAVEDKVFGMPSR